MTYIKWKCSECNDIVISNNLRHHEMDYCKCGSSVVDAEKEYTQWMGSPVTLDMYDYNFFDELILCMKEQRLLEIGTSWNDGKCWITLKESIFIRDLENEICESLK